jgi:hypothetical protein
VAAFSGLAAHLSINELETARPNGWAVFLANGISQKIFKNFLDISQSHCMIRISDEMIRSLKQSKGGAYDYWETRAAGEGYERGSRLGGSPPFRRPGFKAYGFACHL